MIKIPRDYIEGALFYVSSRGDNEEEIFKEGEDYKMYAGLLKKYKGQYGFKLFSFCLMPTHLHLLIELKEGLTVSDIMHDLNANYTKYFNAKSGRKGHLFQERSKMVLAEKASYLLALAAYIHLNPKAKNLVAEAADYPYSSYPAYLYYSGQKDAPGKIDSGEIEEEVKEALGYLGDKKYADYQARFSQEEREGLARELNKNPILGGAAFVEKVKLSARQNSARPAPYSAEEHKRQRRFILAGGAAILVLGILNLGLYAVALGLRQNFRKELERKNMELTSRLAGERQKVYKDLDEKYRADKVSYEAMHKRLEIEKNKVRDLEGKVK